MVETRQAKRLLRKEIAARKEACPADILDELSNKIMSLLEQTTMFQEASCVALYHALPGEVQTAAFIEKWYRRKKILLPLVVGEDLRLLLYEGADTLRLGAFGIQEPKADAQELPEEVIDLIVVPGVAFDKEKNRMGRGRGFYDRLLERIKAPTIGIGFGFQCVPHVPTEPFDRKMDWVITEQGLF